MPSEYLALVTALKALDIPFEEYAWQTRPEGAYGVVSLDMEESSEDGDDRKLDRVWEASVDVFFYLLTEREAIMQAVEGVLTEVCGNSWELNSAQYENQTRLFHYEWVCQVMDAGV